jgi:Protein of unknown function (DUF2798)
MEIPRRFAPHLYGIIQAAITTAVATAIATHQLASQSMQFLWYWLASWLLAWLCMLPVVVLVAPLIHRAVMSLTRRD